MNRLLVKRMKFTRIRDASKFNQYLTYCVEKGSGSILYQDPNIAEAFYDDGTDLIAAIKLAIDNYVKSPKKANLLIRRNKVLLGKIWLNSYADQVEKIANDDANRTTLQEAAANISGSFLTPRKIGKIRKVKPEQPELFGKYVGYGKIDVEILNGAKYKPMMTHFILVESSMNATVALRDGALFIEQEKKGQIVFKSANAKGKYTSFTGLKNVSYDLYAYSQNGNKSISVLSAKIVVWK